MALDAGYDAVVPYTSIEQNEVAGLVQDVIFSRPPARGPRSGIFIAGKDAVLALDMLDAAKKAQSPPFGASIFADPAGSFTTAAAMMACLEKVLKSGHGRDLKELRVVVFGATGVVGFSAAVISALEGARVTLVGHDGAERVGKAAAQIKARFGVEVQAGRRLQRGQEIRVGEQRAGDHLRGTGAAFACFPPPRSRPRRGCWSPPTSTRSRLRASRGSTCSRWARRSAAARRLGVGPLALGDTKYKTESKLFQRMIAADAVVRYDFPRRLRAGARTQCLSRRPF